MLKTILEAGINHNGSMENAFELIKRSAEFGADIIKFQTFKAEEFIVDKSLTYTYRSQGHEITESMFEMFKRYEFTQETWKKISDCCKNNNIRFASTPQNYSDLEILLDIGIDVIKVGSDDLTNQPLLEEYAKCSLPMIISTGMAEFSEVAEAMELIRRFNDKELVVMVCTSEYPTPFESANMRRVSTLNSYVKSWPGVRVGFSDHSVGLICAILARALGATVFEKHFTLSHDLAGPDHWFSMNPEEARHWIEGIHSAEIALGNGRFNPSPKELEMRALARRSVTALRDIQAGEKFTLENIGLRRPGGGLSSKWLNSIIGKVSNRKITQASQIKTEYF